MFRVVPNGHARRWGERPAVTERRDVINHTNWERGTHFWTTSPQKLQHTDTLFESMVWMAADALKTLHTVFDFGLNKETYLASEGLL